MYAGVDGNQVTQGNPPAIKWSPRVGAVYSLNTKTVLRGGYGIYWAPWNYAGAEPGTSNYGQVGFTQNTLGAADGARHADGEPHQSVPERAGAADRATASAR